ncbi:sulfotransferase domain-containing protein [Vibrio natriegens]|uniref:sulfotransferase domain-containing protein n=1 Tax=Vibrio natriegens TaxID=691 RepID=UPI001EFECB77|nr:sulfotransferase domain-containing protein [Vibrio natriegens]MCG9700532.1 sulfotransferase domain-containing protein [Vibrio natriegens]
MRVFLTGMMRSGTTLLQKALDIHPDVSISYQSSTQDFLKCIKGFHRSLNLDKYHLLSHYSGNSEYTLKELNHWLLLNPGVDILMPESDDSKVCGVKEVLAEEFIPFFIKNGIKCILIVRDPRDVIASMSFGNGEEYTGKERPVLFDLRNWRKSVLIGEVFKNEPNLMVVRMEDLLIHPDEVMSSIYSFLEVESLPFEQLTDRMNSSSWKGNSSFGEKKAFDTSAIGNYKKVLPSTVIEYIETICKKEMELMEYDTSISSSNEDIIHTYVEPFKVDRKEFESNYSSSSENVEYEARRLNSSIKSIIKDELGF